MDLTRIGFVGLGNQARENLLPAISQMERARITAICDQDQGRRDDIDRKLGPVAMFDDIAALIASQEADILVMACPPEIHVAGARMAIEAGMPVFVEKPPAATTPELRELVALAQRHGVPTGVGMNFRFASPMNRVRTIAAGDRFGGIAHLDIRHLANKPRGKMWGLDSMVRSFLLAQTIHSFDLAVSFGGELCETVCEIDEVGPDDVILRAHLRFSSGMTASILTGSAFPAFEFGMTAFGRRHGLMALDNLWNLTVRDEEWGAFVPKEKRWSETWTPGPLESGHGRAGYLGELEAFVQAVAEGKRFPADFEALLPTFAIIDEACATPIRKSRPATPETQKEVEPAHV